MHSNKPAPAFAAKLQHPAYYALVFAFIDKMKQTTTLRGIAQALNDAGIRTASELAWTKGRLSNFIRTTPRTFAN